MTAKAAVTIIDSRGMREVADDVCALAPAPETVACFYPTITGRERGVLDIERRALANVERT